jgi:hypothetical protein
MLGDYQVAAQLVASSIVLSSMELISYMYECSVNILFTYKIVQFHFFLAHSGISFSMLLLLLHTRVGRQIGNAMVTPCWFLPKVKRFESKPSYKYLFI